MSDKKQETVSDIVADRHKGDKCVCCARDVIDFIVRGDEETATGLTVGMMPFVSGDTSRRCE